MNKISFYLCLLSLTFSVHAEVNIASQFDNIYTQYQSASELRTEDKIKLLIELDQQLRILIDKPWANRQELKPIDTKLWQEKYQAIGVIVGGYTDTVIYTGKLLTEVKVLDVNLKYGAYTDFTDICALCGSFGEMPDIAGALAYEKKYPNGPFIESTLITIGNFYDDLYKVLKFSDKDFIDYKYECFSKYVSKKPMRVQIEDARQLAMENYMKVLALHSDNTYSNKSIQAQLTNLKSHKSDGWHSCAD